MTDREAMKIALEKCEWGFMEDAANILRQALARLEQKPVALKMVYGEVCYQSKHDDQSFGMWCPITEKEFPNGTPFYTEPPKREWVGLTDDEIDQIASEVCFGYIDVARAIETKLRELNT